MKNATKILLAFPVLLAGLTSAISLDCSHIRVNNKKFDLSKIGGPHSVLVHDENRPPAVYNTTWTVDICQPLKKIKGIPNDDQCEAGTHGRTYFLPGDNNVADPSSLWNYQILESNR